MKRIGKSLPEKYRGPWVRTGLKTSGLIRIQGIWYSLNSREAEESRILQKVDEMDGDELIETVPGGEDISHGKKENYSLLDKIGKIRREGN